MKQHRAWVFALAVALVPLANAGVIDTAQQQASQQSWSAWGGDIGFRWNTDLAKDLGITATKATTPLAKQDFRQHQWFAVRQSGGLQFSVINDALQAITGGSVQVNGGYRLSLRDGSTIDFTNVSLRPRASDPRALDIVGSDGKVWFYSDHVMFKLANHGHELEIQSADIRITPELADRLGTPEAANWSLGSIAMNTQVYVQGIGSPEDACSQSSPTYPWPGHDVPGVDGATYQADLFMLSFSAQFIRCQGCNGSDGNAVFAPSSSLINNLNNGSQVVTIPNDPLGTSTALYTGNIAWNSKFSGSPPNYNYPYKNDQHPFLIWNLYRTNADGSIVQIGRSGVKHAFLTVNADCQGQCYDYNSLGRGCQDTYGTGNNDSSSDLGPRSEIVPATGTWGRCGSIWDPHCTGTEHSNGNNSYSQRLQVRESQIDPAENPGATYKFESWYVARDDINIYNSMATLTVVPHYNSGSQTWSLGGSGYRLGPAIYRWVDPASPPANSMNTELDSSEGHANVAVKVTDNGNGTWTYQYAVMNLDFARARVVNAPAGSGEDPHVVSNKGFGAFAIPLQAGTNVTSATFNNGETSSSDDWDYTDSSGTATWTALPHGIFTNSRDAAAKPTLDWGMLYSFSFITNSAPMNGNASLGVARSGTPGNYSVATLVPSAP